MTQCVPSWPLDGSPSHLNLVLSSHSNNSSVVTDAPEMDYEVAELTWENGQLVMHGLGPPRVPNKPLSTCSPTKYTWDIKPHAGGTLESIVNQGIPHHQKSPVGGGGDRGDDFTRWFDNCLPDAQTTTTISTMAVDALVPTSSTNTPNSHQPVAPSIHVSGNTSRCVVSCSTRVASRSGDGEMARARMGSACEEIPKDFEITESFGNEEVKNLIRSTLYEGHNDTADQTVSQRDTVETGERDLGAERLTATSMGSPENTFKHCNSKTVYAVDDHDFISHSRAQRETGDDEHEDGDEKKGSKISSFSTKRSRAAATHNQSERKRRDRINQRMKTLQKLVPTSSKRTDKASMLDEVIEYLKQLQAQVKAMSRMIHVNMPSPMMLPNMALQQKQQLQMSMMGMPRPMDVNALNCPNITTMPSVLHATAPSNFNMPIASPGASVVPDSLASFLPAAAQSQPMTMDAYGRMAALYRQYLQSNANLGFKN